LVFFSCSCVLTSAVLARRQQLSSVVIPPIKDVLSGIKDKMMTNETLRQKLKFLDGKDYGSYQSILGEYSYPYFNLYIDQIQKDPYAPPSTGIFRVRVPREKANIPTDMTESHIREVALRDFLARQFYDNCLKISKGRRGTGYSGIITIAKPEQAILERSSIVINNNFVEARFFIGLPASGREISAKIAEKMLFDELSQIVRLSLYTENLNMDDIYRHIKTAEDADFLRNRLRSLGLIAFIADGSLLPRASGVDPRPLKAQTVVPFRSPESLREARKTQNTPICVIPGDGRELCASLPGTVKVRASNGRYVIKTDISTFINNLPLQKDTTAFSTENSSGSTSQAASISEAIEAGAEVMLMDEDTCAANFMIRDKRMQQLVAKKNEPITSFIDKIRQLYEEKGISTVLVMGGFLQEELMKGDKVSALPYSECQSRTALIHTMSIIKSGYLHQILINLYLVKLVLIFQTSNKS